MAACSTLSGRGRKNASAGADILEATVQQDKKYDADQNPTGIISLDNADNVFHPIVNRFLVPIHTMNSKRA